MRPSIKEALYSAYKKLRHTIQMTNDKPINRLNYKLMEGQLHFHWPMEGQCDVIFIDTLKSFNKNFNFDFHLFVLL